MRFLSGLFFFLSPFALFCSPNGTGLILCPTFIILGIVFASSSKKSEKSEKCSYTDENGKRHGYKIVTNKQGYVTRVEFDVSRGNFWEWHYKDAITKAAIRKGGELNEFEMVYEDKNARQLATTVCIHNGAPVPSEEMQEQIARKNGVITEKMREERNEKRDRIQIGKFFLMEELYQKYYGTVLGAKPFTNERGRTCFIYGEIRKDQHKIKMSDNRWVDVCYGKSKHRKFVVETWRSLSEEEKNQLTKWIKEYEEKLIEMASEYIEEKRDNVDVKMDF